MRDARHTLNVPAGVRISPLVAETKSIKPEKQRALIVEDEATIARLQTSFLAKLGIAADAVQTGEDAIRFLERQTVDLIISDIHLAGRINGIKFYHWVRDHKPQLAERFLFISGDLTGGNTEILFRNWPVRRLQKPFTFEQYRQAVADILGA